MRDAAAAILSQEEIESVELPSTRVNILVVDDLPEKLLVYRTLLEELNQNIYFANSGEEALKLVLKHDFAVILLDVNMPDMDGIETSALIRKRRKSAHTPIIFLTAFTDDVHITQGYASGAVDYLITPVVPEVLKAKVRVFIELSQMRQQVALQAEERAQRKAAQEADRRKDAFLGMLAHELRNPLGPIRNSIHLLNQMDTGIPDLTKLHAIIERQVAHMTRLVDDLLDSKRLAQSKVLLQKECLDLTQVVYNIAEDYRALFEGRGIELRTEIPTHAVWVDGDKTRLTQMFGNVLHNAHKFTNHGGLVTISLNFDDQEQTAIIKVEDNGVGIDSNVLPYLFDVFYQEEQKLDRALGGLGLGLSLVKSLTELHKGSVKISSQGVGKGATFTFSLPTTTVATARSEDKIKAEAIAPSRILLIEDNIDAAETTCMLLERRGHSVRLAYSGAEGIKLAREFMPHIILCDIGLPGMDGYQVARTMRLDPDLQSTPMIALTGYGRDKDRQQAKEAGFDMHLTKPIDSRSIQNILNLLRKEKAA